MAQSTRMQMNISILHEATACLIFATLLGIYKWEPTLTGFQATEKTSYDSRSPILDKRSLTNYSQNIVYR